MEQYVSIWLGNFNDYETFEKYFHIDYSEDGDSIASNFERDFDIYYYDRDMVEKDWIEIPENRVEILLEGFSYDEQIISKIKLEKSYNTIVLLYGYKYNSDKKYVSSTKYELNFIDVIEYIE
ncbi:hypothetical protein BU202_09070 [Streptococcus cuniculi]|uniref:Immunity 22 family protein n=1 Tax=Streptococcus cuniculi TaxID=1432788 RepID=A0A1Q8E5Z3_9STRE|nr:immunity 22 family protein [Streptococcus cuniculi]OLF47219.1 hypothetical protein BU202_09070 [Streptococcus cuniculi]